MKTTAAKKDFVTNVDLSMMLYNASLMERRQWLEIYLKLEPAKNLRVCPINIHLEGNLFQGFTPIMAATDRGYQDIIVLLANAGADVNYADKVPAQNNVGFERLMLVVRTEIRPCIWPANKIKLISQNYYCILGRTLNFGTRYHKLLIISSQQLKTLAAGRPHSAIADKGPWQKNKARGELDLTFTECLLFIYSMKQRQELGTSLLNCGFK